MTAFSSADSAVLLTAETLVFVNVSCKAAMENLLLLIPV